MEYIDNVGKWYRPEPSISRVSGRPMKYQFYPSPSTRAWSNHDQALSGRIDFENKLEVGLPDLWRHTVLWSHNYSDVWIEQLRSHTHIYGGQHIFHSFAALYYTGVLFMFIISKISRGIGGSPAPYFLTLCSPGCSNATSQYTDQRTMRNYVTHASCPQEEMLPDTL